MSRPPLRLFQPDTNKPQPAEDARPSCPHCGGRNLHTVACITGPHEARTGCSDCKRHIRFEPMTWNLQRAFAFTMPFGKHKGRSLGSLAATRDGRGYLAWVADNIKGNAGQAALIVCENLDDANGKGGSR